VIAIELLAAAQGIDFHAPLTSSKSLESVRERVRAQTPTLEEDRYMHADIAVTIKLLRSGSLLNAVANCGVTLPSVFDHSRH
jgi:histidine ammonia-lyase